MLNKLIKLIFGDPDKQILEKYQPRVNQINEIEQNFIKLSDDELKQKTNEFKLRLSKGETCEELLVEAFATVRETSRRVLGLRHFDVQLIGGMVLHEGNIAEMKTGEGKTLVATLPAYLNALTEKGVYIVTVNDYLAKRDSEWMGQIYTFLGLSVGLIQNNMPPETRLSAYAADITFGTNNEFGFDYLRDNLAYNISDCCQIRKQFAIIDEVDSILIDEARTPLIISGAVKQSTEKYIKIARIAKRLEKTIHFTSDEKHKNIILTDDGISLVEKELGLSNIFSVTNMDSAHIAIQCLKALHLFKKDVDYVIKNGEILIVDEFTGRLMEGRRYSDGLHQAIEAIQGLKVNEESKTLASITFQNYFRMFPKLAGMTGTAVTEAPEFEKIYNLPVVVIPTNKPIQRKDTADVIYKNKKEKYNAIVKLIKSCHDKKQPVLVGTIAIETSELISQLLKKQGISHHVLNAKQHENEAKIITEAGQPQGVTIATNMAGRGTDIVLGEGVEENGGLFVIGSERHESRRIDNQLRGRSGRQGDNGETKFFVSLEDDLMRLFGSDRISKVMESLKMPEDMPIEHGLISNSIERAQSKVEKYHFGIRKQILEYDDVINKQRETIYAIRTSILEGKEIDKIMNKFLTDLLDLYFGSYTEKDFKNPDIQTEIINQIVAIFPIKNLKDVFNKENNHSLKENLTKILFQIYEQKKEEHPNDIFEKLVTRQVILTTMDRKWVDHLNNMDVLRDGIGLRAWGQKDPLIEYKREAFIMFKELMSSIAEETWSMINRAVVVQNSNYESQQLPQVTNDKKNTVIETKEKKKIGRNDKVTIQKGTHTKIEKWKKAEALIKEGWQLVQ